MSERSGGGTAIVASGLTECESHWDVKNVGKPKKEHKLIEEDQELKAEFKFLDSPSKSGVDTKHSMFEESDFMKKIECVVAELKVMKDSLRNDKMPLSALSNNLKLDLEEKMFQEYIKSVGTILKDSFQIDNMPLSALSILINSITKVHKTSGMMKKEMKRTETIREIKDDVLHNLLLPYSELIDFYSRKSKMTKESFVKELESLMTRGDLCKEFTGAVIKKFFEPLQSTSQQLWKKDIISKYCADEVPKHNVQFSGTTPQKLISLNKCISYDDKTVVLKTSTDGWKKSAKYNTLHSDNGREEEQHHIHDDEHLIMITVGGEQARVNGTMTEGDQDSVDELLKQKTINVTVEKELASMNGATCMIECVQGQSQTVMECGNVEAATSLSFIGPVVNGAFVTCSLATSVATRATIVDNSMVCYLGNRANVENCTNGDIRQGNGMSRINISEHATGLTLNKSLAHTVCTETQQQLLQDPSYMRDTQPLQRTPYKQDKNGSLVAIGNDTSTVSLLQCSNNPKSVTICGHSHDVGVKCEDTWNTNITMATIKFNSALNVGISEDQVNQSIQCGSDTPAKNFTRNLLRSENEQQHAQGMSQQIDTSLTPVEEEIHTKPSQRVRVCIDEMIHPHVKQLNELSPALLIQRNKMHNDTMEITRAIKTGRQSKKDQGPHVPNQRDKKENRRKCGAVGRKEMRTDKRGHEGPKGKARKKVQMKKRREKPTEREENEVAVKQLKPKEVMGEAWEVNLQNQHREFQGKESKEKKTKLVKAKWMKGRNQSRRRRYNRRKQYISEDFDRDKHRKEMQMPKRCRITGTRKCNEERHTKEVKKDLEAREVNAYNKTRNGKERMRGKETQRTRGKETPRTRGKETQSTRGKETQSTRGKETQRTRGKETQRTRGKETKKQSYPCRDDEQKRGGRENKESRGKEDENKNVSERGERREEKAGVQGNWSSKFAKGKGGKNREERIGQGEKGGGEIGGENEGGGRGTGSGKSKMISGDNGSLGFMQLCIITFLFLMLLVLPSGIYGSQLSVTVLPSNEYITFENRTVNISLQCLGNGDNGFWTVNGHDSGVQYVLRKGISSTPFRPYSGGSNISSQLIVPATKENNNTTVICTMLDPLFQYELKSNPVKIVLQGVLLAPDDFNMTFSNSSVNLSWKAPVSREVSTPPTISSYIISNNVTNKTMPFSNPSTCGPSSFCNYSLDLRDTFFRIVNGGVDTTILDYNVTVEFTFFAVNGAGNGSAATYLYVSPTKAPTDVTSHPNETLPTQGITPYTPASNPMIEVVIGVVTAVSSIALLVAIIVIVIMKIRPQPPVLLRSVQPPAPHEREDPPSHSTVV